MMDKYELGKSIIIVAHPDDEILWFSSVMEQVNKIIICFLGSLRKPDLGPSRKAALDRYPLLNVTCLDINQSDIFGGANWINPTLTDYGIAVPNRPDSASIYRNNYFEVRQRLAQELLGVSTVFSHNPWGEYGNKEHVQIYRVVKDLQRELNFKLLFPSYFSNKSSSLMLQNIDRVGSDTIVLKTDIVLATQIKKIYQECNCWTWYNNWEWLSEDTFIREQGREDACVPLKEFEVFPLNFIQISFVSTEKRVFKNKLVPAITERLTYIIKKIVTYFRTKTN